MKKLDTKTLNGKVTDTKLIERDGVKIGIVEGYIATWDLDRGDWRYKDQFVRGCFAESIQKFKDDERMPRFKDHHCRTVGGWQYESLKEDKRGLFGIAEINLDVQQGAEAYALAKQGVLTDFSIGFGVIEFTIDETIKKRTITKAEFGEGSIVDEPMNPKANITAVKTALKDLPGDLKELFVFTGESLGIFGKNEKTLPEDVKDAINESYKKDKRLEIIDGEKLIVDGLSLKQLTERQLEGIMSSNNATLTREACKALISYLNFEGLRDAADVKGRDGQTDSGIKVRLDELKQLMETN